MRGAAGKVEKRDMLLGESAGGWIALGVRRPSAMLCRQLATDRPPGLGTGGAVAGNTLGRAGDQRKVVKQACMGAPVISRRLSVCRREVVEGRGRAGAEDSAALMVLKDDHHRV